jgi:aryl-alcohol dehydrogenase-like predicted oxidoreductase
LGPVHEAPPPQDLITLAQQRAVGVMGIRPTEHGALTDGFDRTVPAEQESWAFYSQAAPFRALARQVGESPALLAHRYALSIPGVSTVLLGVKNRTELRECLQAEEMGPLDAELIARIDAAVAAPVQRRHAD